LEAIKDIGSLFSTSGSLALEIGFGNSDNLISSAMTRPNMNYLGCEVHPPGVAQALIAIEDLGLTNVKIFDQDVHDLVVGLSDRSLDSVDIFFPDPWPKKKHVKRRLVQSEFLDTLALKLKKNGIFRFATDNLAYALDVLELAQDNTCWRNLAGDKFWSPRPTQRIVTRFEGKARKAQSQIFEISMHCVI
jgi:tRNA (guanine-N7-)-methyltransferase